MVFFKFLPQLNTYARFFPLYFSCPFCRFSSLVSNVFFYFLYFFVKMKVYSVCARAQAWSSGHSVQKKIAKINCWRNLNDERWSTEWSKVKILEDNQGVDGRFFHKMCEKYYRKSCKYTCNNSKKQKGKKNFNFTLSIRVSSTTVWI